MRVLDGRQHQCANRGHLRVRLSPSAIHCCLPLASFTPPAFVVLFRFSLRATPTFLQSVLFSPALPLVLFLPSGKQNSGGKKEGRLPPLAALRATYNAEPLSKLLSFPLPPSFFPCYCWEELSRFILLPLSCHSSASHTFSVSFLHLLSDRK